MSDRLQSNQQLNINDQLVAPNGKAHLIMQSDGNLVLYRNDNGAALWASNTSGKPVNVAIMQGDGNFVCYGGPPFWSTNTWGNPGAQIVLQDDGNLVVYSSVNTPLWASNTVQDWGSSSPPVISADTDNEEVGWGFRMQTSAKLVKQSGVLDAVTHTWSTNDFLGFTGGVTVWLLDSNGVIIGETDLRTFGVDGRDVPFTQSNRLDHWSQNFDLRTVAQVVKLQIVQVHHPVGRVLTDVQIGIDTLLQAKQKVCAAVPQLPLCK